MRQITDQISPREFQIHEWDVENRDAQFQQQRLMKDMEIEVAKMEAQFSSWLKLPLAIIKLPVWLVMAVGYCIAVARKYEPSEAFWRFMR